MSLSAAIKHRAAELGFERVGIAPATTPSGLNAFHEWLAQGYAGEMHYLPHRATAYEHPRHVLDGVRSIVMLAMAYRTVTPQAPAAGQGSVSRYAWGADYHDLIRAKLSALKTFVTGRSPQANVRGVVDTAPLLEREIAQQAGLGWIGKNTLLLNKQLGSWFFLAALLTDLELEYDEPHRADHCGTCRACLDACPTDAFVDAYILDARKCISYTTIELRGPIPEELRTGQADWLFGCDVCQDVCPWNRKALESRESSFAPREENNPVDLIALFDLDEAAFRRRFRDTPLWRAKRRGLLRNAAIVLGNQRSAAALPALAKGLHDGEPLVRGACAWALGQIHARPVIDLLRGRLESENDGQVRQEIRAAMGVEQMDETKPLISPELLL